MEPSSRIFPPLHARMLIPSDAAFVGKVIAIIEHHLADAEFTTGKAAAEIGLSRMHLNRRLKKLTGFSTRGFIRDARMKEARDLLISRDLSIDSVSHHVGFKSHPHFAKAFRKETGMCPSAYRRAFAAPAQPEFYRALHEETTDHPF